MINTYYVPIYNWGDDPTTIYGSGHGCTMYTTLNDLYGFEGEDVVGYFEVVGTIPTKREFEEKHGIISSGAV